MAHILIYGINYAPEFAGVGRYTGDIGEYLSESGHAVTVITTPPHYPGWKTLSPYRNGGYTTETRRRVKIIRCPLILRERMGGVWRLIAPASFALASAPVALWQILRRRPDTVLCIEPTLLAAPVALLAAGITGAMTVLHVQDLEVDAAFAVGHLGSRPWLRRLAGAFERATLRRFDRVITISAKMAEHLAAKGVAADRIAVVRNWVDLDHIKPIAGVSLYRRELGIPDEGFVVLYSGNIGAKQGLDHLMTAIGKLAARADIHFIVAGEGPSKADLVERFGSVANLRFLPFQPSERLSDFLGLADMHVLPQQPGVADLMLPSKLGGMLASERRIVVTAAADTELATFLDGAAVIVAPEDPEALAEAIRRGADDARFGDDNPRRRGQLANQLSKPTALRHIGSKLVRSTVDQDPRAASLRVPGAREPDRV